MPTDPREILSSLRARLDVVDQSIVELIAERQRVVSEVIEAKLGSEQLQLRDILREEQLLRRVVELSKEAGADSLLLTRIYQQILAQSVRTQRERLMDRDNPSRVLPVLRVAYQGTVGSYSHQAARRHFAAHQGEVAFQGHPSFRSMLSAVQEGEANYGVLPIENTTAGSIIEAYDLLAEMALHIVGEEVQRVEHCLLGLQEVPLQELHAAWSHPQALLQCSQFFEGLPTCTPRAWTDTAGSCEKIRDEGDIYQVAVASESAAALYGLKVLRRGIANQRANFTRMVIVSPEPVEVDPRIPCKTSLLFTTPHEHGALLRCLGVLEAHALNLTQLQSRPRANAPWEYVFYVDFEGSQGEQRVAAAIRELRGHTGFLRVLGSYPATTTGAARPAEPARPRGLARPASHRRPVQVGHHQIGADRLTWVVGFASPVPKGALWPLARALKEVGGGVLVGLQDQIEEVIEVAAEVGVPVGCVVSPGHLSEVARRVDLLVLSVPDSALASVQEAAGRQDLPVLIQRHPAGTLGGVQEAIDRISEAGNRRVIVADGGVARGTPEGLPRAALDLGGWSAIEGCPILVEPSRLVHGVADVARVIRACQAAGACGALLWCDELGPEGLEQVAHRVG